MRQRLLLAALSGLLLPVIWVACNRREPEWEVPSGGGGSDTTATTGTGFESDGAAICGSEEHTALREYPTIYFVLDRSGSMLDPAPGGGTRWEAVRSAVHDMVDSLGALVRVGAALYPAVEGGDVCSPGDEVYSPKIDPAGGFVAALDVEPAGGTPTAATLEAVRQRVADLPQPRVIILATDGAPNCNPDITCPISECMPNVGGICPLPPGESCCEPPNGDVRNCIDRNAALTAVQALHDEGTDVYVVGIPGSDKFATLLDQMALLGGVPQPSADTFYYRVDDLSTLADLFKQIAGELVSCTFDLSDPPEEQGLTNVYFDQEPVLQDPVDGWVWLDGDTIELVGAACQELKSGGVKNVQIVSGCPTLTPQ